MHIEHLRYMSNFWKMMATMIEDNYLTPENQNATLLLGLCVHNSVENIKRSGNIPTEKVIAYQTEPLVDNHWHNKEKIIGNLQGADEVWDYDLENIEILRSYGIDAKFKPPAYSPRLKRIQNKENPDIDILFFGSMTDYRYRIISSFLNDMPISNETADIFYNLNFVWLHNIDDHRLDDYIGRSKIILNLKPYEDTKRQQQTRIFYPLMNDKCILSEKSAINYFGDSIQQFNGLQEMYNKAYNILRYDQWKNAPHQRWLNGKDKSKLAIFIHLFQIGNWQEIFEEQICKLQQSGLYDTADYIHIGINGSGYLPYEFYRINRIKKNVNIELEADTLSDLHSFCLANPEYKVIYLHSKGVTHVGDPAYPNIEAWRRYLEHFVIAKWKDCVDLLNSYDTVGTEWEDTAHIADTKQVLPHYAGNFWWATAKYISKLDKDFLYIKNDWPRWQGEFWIGTGNPNFFNFKSTGKNKYCQYIDPIEYME